MLLAHDAWQEASAAATSRALPPNAAWLASLHSSSAAPDISPHRVSTVCNYLGHTSSEAGCPRIIAATAKRAGTCGAEIRRRGPTNRTTPSLAKHFLAVWSGCMSCQSPARVHLHFFHDLGPAFHTIADHVVFSSWSCPGFPSCCTHFATHFYMHEGGVALGRASMSCCIFSGDLL